MEDRVDRFVPEVLSRVNFGEAIGTMICGDQP